MRKIIAYGLSRSSGTYRISLTCRFYVACLVAGVVFSGVVGCRREASDPPRHAILILLDAARPDRFSCYGYDRITTPEMDRLASQGVLFRKHFAQATHTRASVSSLMYSRFFCLPLFPHNAQVPYSTPTDLFRRADDAQISFVKVLEADGFKTAAISAHLWTGRNTTFAAEFTEMHDLAARFGTPDRPKPSAEVVIAFAIDWIRENKDHDYFLYIHLMDTHVPHFFEADAQGFFGAGSFDARNFGPSGVPDVLESELSETDRRYANALYDGSLRYADRHIGRLAEFLRRENLLDSTLLAITSDHGEYLFDDPRIREGNGKSVFAHGGPWFDPLAKIPLIIHYPRVLKPTVFDELSEGVDVGPTLLGLLNVATPPGKEFDGLNLVDVIHDRAPPKRHVFGPRSIRTNRYKCMFETPDGVLLGESPPDPQSVAGKMYDVVADPGETIDLFQAKPDTVAELLVRYRTSLQERFRRFETARSSDQPQSAFAISARHMRTESPLYQANDGDPPDGWSRLTRGPRHFIVAMNSPEPLPIQFPMPNGAYGLSMNINGHVVVEVGDQRRELNAKGVVEFGTIEVTEELFRATIHAAGTQPIALSFFGFSPPAMAGEDQEKLKEQTDRLRSLGYVD